MLQTGFVTFCSSHPKLWFKNPKRAERRQQYLAAGYRGIPEKEYDKAEEAWDQENSRRQQSIDARWRAAFSAARLGDPDPGFPLEDLDVAEGAMGADDPGVRAVEQRAEGQRADDGLGAAAGSGGEDPAVQF